VTVPELSERARRVLVLATVCVSLGVITMNISTINVGLPSLARELGATNTGLEWIVDSYALVFAGLLLTAGSLGDRLGRRNTLLVGLAVFGAGSVGAALVNTTAALIAMRCVMGVGAACVMPMTLSILTNIYTTEDGLRGAIAAWAAVAAAAGVGAPLVAGLLLSHFWWGSLFVLNVPICMVVIVAVLAVVPDTRTPAQVPIDWIGVLLSIVFLTGLVGSLIEGPDRGWGDPLVVGGIAGSMAVFAGFCVWELRTEHPLINVRFFRVREFSAGCTVVSLMYFFSFGVSFVVTQYLQLVLGYSPLKAGVVLMPTAAVVMVVSPIGARAFGRYGARRVILVALVVMAGSGVALVTVGVGSSLWPAFASLMANSMSCGLMTAGTTSMVMGALPVRHSGMASGAQSATRQLGGALGVAIIGSLLAARYASSLTMSLTRAGKASFAPTARRSLAAALDVPQTAASTRTLIAHLARTAFVDGLHTVGVTVTVLSLLSAAVMGVVVPRRARAYVDERSLERDVEAMPRIAGQET
jgi:EmrB/QacA subfamily drug resistance transporter